MFGLLFLGAKVGNNSNNTRQQFVISVIQLFTHTKRPHPFRNAVLYIVRYGIILRYCFDTLEGTCLKQSQNVFLLLNFQVVEPNGFLSGRFDDYLEFF